MDTDHFMTRRTFVGQAAGVAEHIGQPQQLACPLTFFELV